MDTVSVLEVMHICAGLSVIVVATTDEYYDNRKWVWGHHGTDTLGGHDPYSVSKACAKLVVASYRRTFFVNGPLLVTDRANNIIGGGDWLENRLTPDTGCTMYAGTSLVIRSLHAMRSW